MRRLISIDEAAEYTGCKNVGQFYAEWRKGLWPDPYPINSRPLRWDIEALKGKIDAKLVRPRGFDADISDLDKALCNGPSQ